VLRRNLLAYMQNGIDRSITSVLQLDGSVILMD
jgi:hypothetical protein